MNSFILSEDFWSPQKLNAPFPTEGTFKASPNGAIALLMRPDGLITFGGGYNEGGALKATFCTRGKMLAGPEVPEYIQLLRDENDHAKRGFFYEWISAAEFLKNSDLDGHRKPVEIKPRVPALWPEKSVIGVYDRSERRAMFASDGKYHEIPDAALAAQRIEMLMMNTKGGPPSCDCSSCAATMTSHKRKLSSFNEWDDVRDEKIPPERADRMMKAMQRPLITPLGPQEQMVTLWYLHGKPVMGRATIEKGKLRAVFVANGKEYTGFATLGPHQVLLQHPVVSVGFEYSWIPYENSRSTAAGSITTPLQVGSVCPCIIDSDGFEVLGSLDTATDIAEGSLPNGKCVKLAGAGISKLLVLCRRDRDDIIAL